MKITVVTPSLNGAEYLPECIESVRRQSGPSVEVEHIFVDGGSTDGTPRIAGAAGCTVLTRDENSVTVALNKGARHAGGTLIGMLGCDDVLMPGALARVAERYRREGRRWLIGGCRWIDPAGGSLGEHKAPPRWITPRMLASVGWSPIPALSTFLHRDLLRELDYFDARFDYAADYDLYARALAREPFSRIGCTLAAQRRHGTNLSMDRNARHEAELRSIAERHGSRDPGRRAVYRYGLKIWFNAASPTWFVRKRLDQRRGPPDAPG